MRKHRSIITFIGLVLFLVSGTSAKAALTFTTKESLKIVELGTTVVDIEIRVTGDGSTDKLQFYSIEVVLLSPSDGPSASFVDEATLTTLTNRTSNPDYVLNGVGVDSTGASAKPVIRDSATRLFLQDGVSIPKASFGGSEIDNTPVTVKDKLVANVRFTIDAPGAEGFKPYQLILSAKSSGVKKFAASGTPGGAADWTFKGGAATDVSISGGAYTGTDLTTTTFSSGSVMAVPEPSSAFLLGIAAVGLMFRRRRSS